MKHALDTNLAAQYGVNIALLLESFQYWTFKNLTREHHILDGLCWSYDTLDALCEVFPYWTRRQIDHTIINAVKHGLLVKGNYNQTKYDRTLWYALTPKAYVFFPDLVNEKYLKMLYSSISQNCEIDYTNFRNRFPTNVTPIPPTDPPTNKDINNISTSAEISNKDYNEIDGKEGNEKSDYLNTHGVANKNNSQVVESEIDPTKSDYFDNQPINCTISSKKINFGIKQILNENPHNIPEQNIEDWIENRKKKKVPVTKTAWNKINKELAKCDDPISAFEEMVAAGWQSFKADWVNKKPEKSSKQFFDHESIKWAEGIEQDLF